MEKQNLNTEPDSEPATIPAFTLVDAIKHIFTNRKISEIETLLDSYPADVQQIIAGFLGPRSHQCTFRLLFYAGSIKLVIVC